MCSGIFRDSLALFAFGIQDLCLPFLAFPPEDTCHNAASYFLGSGNRHVDPHFLPASDLTDAASLVSKKQLGMAVLAERLLTPLRDCVIAVGLGYSGKGD